MGWVHGQAAAHLGVPNGDLTIEGLLIRELTRSRHALREREWYVFRFTE